MARPVPPSDASATPMLPTMRPLAGGAFLMGDDNGRGDEKPVHRVVIVPFELGVYPVSNAEYAVFLVQTGHEKPNAWGEKGFDRSNLPVCGVSWFDAVAYADWLNEITRATAVKYHLPTEAQREYAARGGLEQRAYPWGDDATEVQAMYPSVLDGPTPLGQPDPPGANGFGLYHMSDNVHEWCADYYAADYYMVSPSHDPRGPTTPTDRRAARGGSWRHHVKFARCAARSSLAPDKRFTDFGFRLARSEVIS